MPLDSMPLDSKNISIDHPPDEEAKPPDVGTAAVIHTIAGTTMAFVAGEIEHRLDVTDPNVAYALSMIRSLGRCMMAQAVVAASGGSNPQPASFAGVRIVSSSN